MFLNMFPIIFLFCQHLGWKIILIVNPDSKSTILWAGLWHKVKKLWWCQRGQNLLQIYWPKSAQSQMTFSWICTCVRKNLIFQMVFEMKYENVSKLKVALRHECSPVNFLHISRTPFLKNTSGRQLQ